MSGKDLSEVQIKGLCGRNSGFLLSFYDCGCILQVFLSVRSLETGQCRFEALLLLQGVVIKNRTAHAPMTEIQTLEN